MMVMVRCGGRVLVGHAGAPRGAFRYPTPNVARVRDPGAAQRCENPSVNSRDVPASRRAGLMARLTAVLCIAVLTIALGPAAALPAAQSLDTPCDVRTSERVVAIGDVHGAYDRFVAILTKAGLIDARGRWAGGRAVFVQTGDVVDRGPDSRRALDLVKRLEQEAARAGGRVFALLGNHEVMRMVGDWRYVSAGEFAAFRNGSSSDLRNALLERAMQQAESKAKDEKRAFDEDAFRVQFEREVPLGFIEMRQAFDPQGDYGKWLRTHSTVVRVNGVAFMHGGTSEDVAALGCEAINSMVRSELAELSIPVDQAKLPLSAGESGPLWYRGLAQEPEPAFAPALERILKSLDAHAIVVGHTPNPGRVLTRFGGRVIAIDSGMLDGQFFPGGVASALELQGGTMTAIYEDRRERIETPALAR